MIFLETSCLSFFYRLPDLQDATTDGIDGVRFLTNRRMLYTLKMYLWATVRLNRPLMDL